MNRIDLEDLRHLARHGWLKCLRPDCTVKHRPTNGQIKWLAEQAIGLIYETSP